MMAVVDDGGVRGEVDADSDGDGGGGDDADEKVTEAT